MLFTLAVVSLTACGEEASNKQTPETVTTPSRYTNLISKYKPITFDTLQVFSAYEINSETNKFKGTKLDSTDFKLLPAGMRTESFDDFYACFQFPLDGTHIALITRTPSFYDVTSLKLLVYDKSRDTISRITELAENVGDGGAQTVKTSWLFKEGQQYVSLIFVEETLDHSIDDENPVARIDTTRSYSLVEVISRDTLNADASSLEKRFRTLLRTRELLKGNK
jgi:hypothetical protein